MRHMQYVGRLSILALSLLGLTSCVSPKGETSLEKAGFALQMRDEVLADFAERSPAASERLNEAPGYVAWRGFHLHPGLFTVANGYYVITNNRTGQTFHGSMLRLGIGPGLALKTHRGVAILGSEDEISALAESRLGFGYLAEAAFRFGSFGGSGTLVGPLGNEAYMWTETGLALEGAIGIIKSSANEELNEAAATP